MQNSLWPSCLAVVRAGAGIAASIVSASIFCLPAHADESNNSSANSPVNSSGNLIALIDSKPINELWLNPGFYSYHWQRDKDLNGNNYGIGADYRFSTVLSATLGEFYNSDRDHSKYVGIYYQPVAIGQVRFGAAIGGFNGYPKEKNGGWFLAAIPTASYEYERVGINVMFVPSYKDRLYGALSFQLKLKVF
jgi:hypothetical protein